jgi:hypothetical protein
MATWLKVGKNHEHVRKFINKGLHKFDHRIIVELNNFRSHRLEALSLCNEVYYVSYHG